MIQSVQIFKGKARCDNSRVTNFTSNLVEFVTLWMNHGRSSSFSSPNSSQHARMRSESNILPRISEPQYLDDIGGRHRLMRYPWKKVAIGAGIFFTLLWLLSPSRSTLGTPGQCNLSSYDSIHQALTELCTATRHQQTTGWRTTYPQSPSRPRKIMISPLLTMMMTYQSRIHPHLPPPRNIPPPSKQTRILQARHIARPHTNPVPD